MGQVENQDVEERGANSKRHLVLSFNPVGKHLQLGDVEAEYVLMRKAYENPAPEKAKPGDDPEKAEVPSQKKDPRVVPIQAMDRVGRKSGTHLIKLVSARADGDHAVLRVTNGQRNEHPKVLPSVNAADIGIAKIVYRPLEIEGYPTKSLVDHILNPDDISDKVCAAFAAAFSEEHLEVLRSALLMPLSVGKLSAGEFPIIFIPRPGGGDLQITPVSPAPSFMDMKAVMSPYFLTQSKEEGAARVPRGKWSKRAISSKPQNISGAIGGPRCSFLAEMPSVMHKMDADIYRFVKGGSFPRWNEPEIDTWVLRYADLLDGHDNKDTRHSIDRRADRLIHDARAFADEILEEARIVARTHGIDPDTLASPPRASVIIFRRYWPKGSSDRARKVLNGAHFDYRERQTMNGGAN